MPIRVSVAVWSPDDSNSIYPPTKKPSGRRVFWVGFMVLQPKQLGTLIGLSWFAGPDKA
jgi:hypothetical protein